MKRRASLGGEIYFFTPKETKECPTLALDTSKLDGHREPTDKELAEIEKEEDRKGSA